MNSPVVGMMATAAAVLNNLLDYKLRPRPPEDINITTSITGGRSRKSEEDGILKLTKGTSCGQQPYVIVTTLSTVF